MIREIDIGQNLHLSAVPRIFETHHLLYADQDTLCIIEERIQGESLDAILASGKKYSIDEVVDFLEQGLSFIRQLEENKIVHRDIKPSNIILSAGGKYYFIDFGIARLLDEASLTLTKNLLGPHSPGYSAPEQFNNLKDQIDSRADIFSLGVVLYECITGVNPFRDGSRSHLEILQKTATITPVSFQIKGDNEQQLVALISSMMGKYASRRPRNAQQALNWLAAAKMTFRKA